MLSKADFEALFSQLQSQPSLPFPDDEDGYIFSQAVQAFPNLPIKFLSRLDIRFSLPLPPSLWSSSPYFYSVPIYIHTTPAGLLFKSYKGSYYYLSYLPKKPLFGFFYPFKPSLPIILTEGAKDCLILKTCYPNTLALLGLHLSQPNLLFLKQLSPVIFILFDNDSSGIKSAHKLSSLLKQKGFQVHLLRCPSGKDIAQFAYQQHKLNNPNWFSAFVSYNPLFLSILKTVSPNSLNFLAKTANLLKGVNTNAG